MVRSVDPPGKWKIVVVDAKSVKILSSACKMYDVMDENVTREHRSFDKDMH